MLKTGIQSNAYFGFEDYEQGMLLMKEHGYDGFDYQGLASVPNSPLYKMSCAASASVIGNTAWIVGLTSPLSILGNTFSTSSANI